MSEAGTFSAFGPKAYQRGQGQPVTVTDPVTVQNPTTTYTLRITNGGLNHSQFPLVTGATVTLNGALIARQSDFNGNVQVIEKPVTLTASNILAVNVTDGGQQAGFLLEIVGIDNDPPTISASVTPQANADGWHNSPVTVAFTCTDATSGIASCPATQTVSTDGLNQVVSGTAIDRAGNSASTSVSLNLDMTPPTLQAVLTPTANAAGWHKSPVVVSFTATDSLSGVKSSSPQSSFATEGMNQAVPGTATDVAGNSVSITATVNLDLTDPGIVVTTPANTIFREPEAVVSGTVSDTLSGIAAVTCNGVAGTVSGGSFQCAVPLLAVGLNTIVAQVQDRAGRIAQVQRGVVFQPGPAITITAPPNLSSFNRPVIAVSGTVSAEAVEVKCNEVVVGLNAGTFGGNVPLKEGNTILTCVAEDGEGNIGSASISVSLDSMPPRVTIDSPTNNAVVVATPVTVTGIVNDLVMGTVNGDEAGVSCNGVPAQVANRRFLVPAVPLTVGANPIICIGEDKVGNVDAMTITVTYNPTVPKQITMVSGNNQTAGIETTLPEPLTVALTENGTPAVGKAVVFKVLQNDGVLTADGQSGRRVTVSTDNAGRAAAQFAVGTWAGAGNNQVDATATGFLGEARFSASAVAAGPQTIVVDAGTLQFGAIGQPLPKPFVVAVVDRGSNRLGGVPVTFRVVAGGGTFNGQSEVTIMTDTDGRAATVLTVGLEEGFDNNVVEATFPNNPGAAAAFLASGKIAGDPDATTISGVVLDNSNNPVAGVTLHVEDTGLTTLSDAQGQFKLQSVPVGRILLIADGSTVPPRNGMPWPKLEYEMVTIAGRDNTVGMPIYLLPIDTPRGILVDETHGGTLTLDELPGFSLTVVPGSATFPDGGRRGTVSVTLVHGDKVPMVPNFGQQPRFIITVQPAGTLFNPPAAMTMPNVDGLLPGQKTEMYSFDHDLGAFVSIGPATVSEDGTVVQSDPGVGVVKGGWVCDGNPSPAGGSAGDCPDCQKCQGSECVPDPNNPPPDKLCCRDEPYDPQTQCCDLGGVLQKFPVEDFSQCLNLADRVGHTPTHNNDCSPYPVPDNPVALIYPECASIGQAPSFLPACITHDLCYDTCQKVSPSSGAEPSTIGQKTCDTRFEADLLAVCNGISNESCRNVCLQNVNLLYLPSVRAAGYYFSYAASQRNACQCCP